MASEFSVILTKVGLLLITLQCDLGSPVLVLQDSMSEMLPTITGLNKEIRVFRGNLSAFDFFHQPYLEDNYFLIGARNIVYNISLSNLTENKRITWYSSTDDVQLCLMRQKTPLECQNFIRVIAKISKDEFLVCGTNAFRPLCRTYRSGQKRNYLLVDEESGVARCPYDPAHNSTAVYVGKKLYSATVADLSGRDSLIFSKPLRTEQHDSQWLNDPNFVSSFAHDGRVYFFFRETAVENINCGKAVFSRVARVCINDTGGARVLRNTWTSFFKTRLNCSIPGEFPFYFDEIQSTSDLGEGNLFPTLVQSDRISMVYALFSTSRNSLRGTAVCAYKFSDIVSTFEGAYKEQRTAYSNWLSVRESDIPEPHPAKSCPNDSQILSDQTLNFIKSHPLMDKSVLAFGGQPLIIQTSLSYSFSQIVVDWQVSAADQRFYDVLFIGTDDGRVLKVLNKGRDKAVKTVIIEAIVLFPNGAPITSLKISKSNGRHAKKLIAVSRDEIRAIELHRCYLKTTCSSCVSLRDPYCSWYNDKCINSNLGLQSIETGRHTKCPHDAKTEVTTVSQSASSSITLCQPCFCKDYFSSEQPKVSLNSLKSGNNEVHHQRTILTSSDDQQQPQISKDIEEGEINTDILEDDLQPCVNKKETENNGYSLTVLMLVAILPAIFTFVVGICTGYCLAVQGCVTTSSHKNCATNEKNLFKEESQKSDWSNQLNCEQRYKVVVNEFKANNSKLPNGGAESSLQKANLDCL